ncbi:Pentatricopeptide repeat-containing protein [Quillaja saponaria]|uniref:Pentatricopeptide repeat-containing protein n=1 Tax=Quillaja saponaria TaxID=32244 RepID=A0AAD7LCQ9_QUISA|nr:Pentatricopeptide repeat-containing protein [Quillaja saponaria]
MSFLTPNSLGSLVESAILTRSSLLGRAVHAQIIKTLNYPLPSFLSNHLVNLYSKLNLLKSAQLVLSLTPYRTVVTWTSLISGSVQNGHFMSALLHFGNMLHECIQPNDFTFPCAFKASSSLQMPVTGKQVHALAVKSGQICDVFVGCSAFDMYSKTGFRDEAWKMFNEMPERNIATWNAYISNAVLDGRSRNAIVAFKELLHVGGEPNSITFCVFLNACSDTSDLKLGRQLHGFVIRSGYGVDLSVSNGLIDFYGKCQEVGSSEIVFERIDQRNDVSWCSMIATYVQNNEEEKACMVFLRARKEALEPTDFMISSVLSACAELAGLELGSSVHALAVKVCVEGNIFVGSALVDMYGKCGSIEDAEQVFSRIPERNVITWNAMIGGYSHQACSRAGAVEIGLDIFESMRVKYGVEPGAGHFACVVDLLGRAGM